MIADWQFSSKVRRFEGSKVRRFEGWRAELPIQLYDCRFAIQFQGSKLGGQSCQFSSMIADSLFSSKVRRFEAWRAELPIQFYDCRFAIQFECSKVGGQRSAIQLSFSAADWQFSCDSAFQIGNSVVIQRSRLAIQL
jgi:hypothetical protein